MTDIAISIEESYRANSPRSRELFEKGRPFTAGPAKGAYFYPPYPLTMERGEGAYLYDVDGRRYVDCANHHTAQILGHNHPAVVEAVQQQLKRGIALGSPTGVETEIAEEMCRRVDSLDRVRFVNSGTEATLHAIRLARGFSKKFKIAKFEGGYHGTHDIVEVSVAPPLDQAGPADAPHSLPTAGGISPNAPSEVVVLPYDDEAAVDTLVEKHRDELACIMFDPKAGILPQRPEFVRAVGDIARRHNVLLVFDEIVGFRMGAGGLQAHYGIDPDLTCFGKIVGGGFPVGALGGRADILDLFDNTGAPTGFFQSGTFSAHPITMAAGLAMLGELTDEAFAHLNGLADRLRQGLHEMFARENIKAQMVHNGSVFSIYFTDAELRSYRDLAAVDRSLASPVFLALLEEEYFLSHGLGMCALSLPMEDGHIDGLVTAMQRAIERASQERE